MTRSPDDADPAADAPGPVRPDGAKTPAERMHRVRPEDAPALDFSTPVRRGGTDGREEPDAESATTRADPAGSGAHPMGAGRPVGTAKEAGAAGAALRDVVAGSTGAGPVRVELYGKPACHLCDEARVIVERVVAAECAELVEHDITVDEALMERYGEYIPVIVVEGRQHSTWRVDAGMLTRAIRAARRGRGRWPFRPRWSRRPRP